MVRFYSFYDRVVFLRVDVPQFLISLFHQITKWISSNSTFHEFWSSALLIKCAHICKSHHRAYTVKSSLCSTALPVVSPAFLRALVHVDMVAIKQWFLVSDKFVASWVWTRWTSGTHDDSCPHGLHALLVFRSLIDLTVTLCVSLLDGVVDVWWGHYLCLTHNPHEADLGCSQANYARRQEMRPTWYLPANCLQNRELISTTNVTKPAHQALAVKAGLCKWRILQLPTWH